MRRVLMTILCASLFLTPSVCDAMPPQIKTGLGGAGLSDGIPNTPEGLKEWDRWVDLMTGWVYEIPAENQIVHADGITFVRIPAYDSPCFVAERAV